MLRKIDKLILRSFTGPFFAAFSVILFILVLQFLSKYLDDIFGKGFEADVIAKVFLYACATLVTMALPLGVLLSSLMTIGNMGEHYEMAALKSSGVGLFKTMRPLVGATIVIMFFSAWFSFFIVPVVNLKLYTLLYDLSKVKPSFAIKPKHFYTDLDGYVIHVADIDREKDILYKIKIYDHQKDIGNLRIIMADSGKMVPNENAGYLMINLFHGVSHEDIPKELGKEKTYQYQRYYFDTLDYRVNLTGFEMEESNPSTFAPHHYMKDIFELYHARDSMDTNLDSLVREFGTYAHKYVRLDSGLVDEEYRMRKFEKRRKNEEEKAASLKAEEEKKKLKEAAEAKKKGEGKDGEKAGKPPGKPKPGKADDAEKAKPDNKAPPKEVLPAREMYAYSPDKPVTEWFEAPGRIEILNKAIHASRAVKNYAIVINDRLKNESLKRRKFSIEFNYRLVLPLSCLVFLFLGAPLGAIIRKGGVGMPLLFSIIFFIIFYILMLWGRKFARDEILPVWLGVWLPIVVMFPFAIFFSYKASRDAPILDMSLWYKILKPVNKYLIAWWWPFKKKETEETVSFWDNPRFNLTEEEIDSLPDHLKGIKKKKRKKK